MIGRTDMSGRWSTAGKFEQGDFGNWSEAWTVGGKLANPVVTFSVHAPCLESPDMVTATGIHWAETCETSQGWQTFSTASDTEPFRTLDGRVIPGRVRSEMTAEQYQMETMEFRITSDPRRMRLRQLGDNAAILITKIVGANALSDDEVRNVLSIIRAAFEKADRIPHVAKNSSATLPLLQNLAYATERESLRRQIDETMAFVQAQ
jgi:hypothetical protein